MRAMTRCCSSSPRAHGSLDTLSLVWLASVSKRLQEDVHAALGALESITIDRDVPAEQIYPLCSALAQLRGELIVGDCEECDGFNGHGGVSTVQLPQTASVRCLHIGPGNYFLRIPMSLATWPQFEVVNWRHDWSFGCASHVELIARAPSLKTLCLVVDEVNDADLLDALLRLCDKQSVTQVTLEIHNSGTHHIFPGTSLHKCPAWERLAAAHGIAGSNKLFLDGMDCIWTRGRHSDWFAGAVSTARGNLFQWCNPAWVWWPGGDESSVYDELEEGEDVEA